MLDRFKVTRTFYSAVSKLLHFDLLGVGDEGDDENAERADDAPMLQQMGVAVRPLIQRTLRALGWRYGDEVWVLKLWDKARTITDLLEGETRVYSVGKLTVAISLRQDGSLRANSDGGDLVLNNGTLKVARDTDSVVATTAFGTWLAAVAAATGTGTPPTPMGSISGGATTVKA